MTTKFTFLILLVTISAGLFSQSTSINQTDSLGKKDGKWFVYLDKDWAKLSDSTNAVYFRYTYFDHGTNVYPMGKCGGKDYRLEGGKTRILNGEYKWYDAKGRLSSVHVFNDGEYVSCKEYFTTGQLSQHFDYTKKCYGQVLGWTVFIYNKKGELVLESPTCKDESGKWPLMR